MTPAGSMWNAYWIFQLLRDSPLVFCRYFLKSFCWKIIFCYFIEIVGTKLILCQMACYTYCYCYCQNLEILNCWTLKLINHIKSVVCWNNIQSFQWPWIHDEIKIVSLEERICRTTPISQNAWVNLTFVADFSVSHYYKSVMLEFLFMPTIIDYIKLIICISFWCLVYKLHLLKDDSAIVLFAPSSSSSSSKFKAKGTTLAYLNFVQFLEAPKRDLKPKFRWKKSSIPTTTQNLWFL